MSTVIVAVVVLCVAVVAMLVAWVLRRRARRAWGEWLQRCADAGNTDEPTYPKHSASTRIARTFAAPGVVDLGPKYRHRRRVRKCRAGCTRAHDARGRHLASDARYS